MIGRAPMSDYAGRRLEVDVPDQDVVVADIGLRLLLP